MPPKKVKKPKKPVQQKQKQKQSQRVIVNVNQPKRAAAKRRQARKPQQVVYQPLITTSGSVPVPMPYPIQSTAGFAPSAPTPSLGTPANLSSPVVLPSFAGEETVAIGGEDVAMPVLTPVPAPTPEPIVVPTPPYRPPPPSIINENRPVIRIPPPIIAPSPITTPPPSLVTDKSDSSFIKPPRRADDKSVSTLLSEISRISSLTGMPPELVARSLEIKSKKPSPPPPPPSLNSEVSRISSLTGMPPELVARALEIRSKKPSPPPPNSVASQKPQMLSLINPDLLDRASTVDTPSSITKSDSSVSVPDNEPVFYTKENMSVAGAPASLPTISTRSGFYNEPFKGSFTNKPIIAEPKEIVVLKKPELKRSDPYDVFSSGSGFEDVSPMKRNESSSSTEELFSDVTKSSYKGKQPNKREVFMSSESERDVDIPIRRKAPTPAPVRLTPVKEKRSNYKSLGERDVDIPIRRKAPTPAPVRLTPVKEKRSNYKSLGYLQDLAKEQKLSITRPNGKKKTRNELLLELSVK